MAVAVAEAAPSSEREALLARASMDRKSFGRQRSGSYGSSSRVNEAGLPVGLPTTAVCTSSTYHTAVRIHSYYSRCAIVQKCLPFSSQSDAAVFYYLHSSIIRSIFLLLPVVLFLTYLPPFPDLFTKMVMTMQDWSGGDPSSMDGVVDVTVWCCLTE